MTDDEMRLIYGFKNEAASFVGDNDIDAFNSVMLSEEYSALKKEEKEWYVLRAALALSDRYKEAEAFLKYLILDYKISEDIFNNMENPTTKKRGEEMFAKRKWAEELALQLKVNDGKINKRLKV